MSATGNSAPFTETNLPSLNSIPLCEQSQCAVVLRRKRYEGDHMNRLICMTRHIAFAVVICGLPCLAKTPSGTLQVDVNNYVLYNYDTFDTTQFAMNPSATIVPMKTTTFT